MAVNQNKKTLAYNREWLTKPGFTGDDFCAYVFILSKILDDGVFPSRESIRKRLGASDRHTGNVLDDLIRFGIIEKTEDGYEFLEKDTLEYNRENPDD